MALVFGDSFDHYPVADIGKKWTTLSAGDAVMVSDGAALAPHAMCLRLFNSNYVEKALPAALATFVSGFWWRHEPAFGTARIIAAFMDSATPANIHVSLRLDTTGHLTFCRDATVLATSTNTFTAATWHHIEVKATIGDAPNGAYEVRVDGSDTNWIPAATGADTRNSGNASIGSVRIYGGVNSVVASILFQDFYLLNTTGAQASDFLGPCRFAVLHPVGAGTTAEWTGNYADNWANVAERVGNSDATFNQSSTAGQTDQFAMTDVPAGTVHAIQHVIMAKRDAGGARTIRPVTRIAGADYNGTTVTVAATYAFHCEPVVFSPATGGATAYTAAELNGAEFGYELVS